MSKKLRLGLVMALGLLAALVAGVVSADHSWGNYHWARTADVDQLPLSLGDNVSGNWDAHLRDANSVAANPDWNDSAVLSNSVDPGRTSPRKCSPSTGYVEVCNAKYGFNGWLGIAGIWVSGDHIAKGYVKVNDSYFNLSYYNTPAWRQYVMCQEIGHVFGLGHQDVEFDNPNLNSCMDYTSSPETNQRPNDHDYDQLVAIYHNGDDYNSWAPAPSGDDGGGGSGGNGNGKGKKGDAPGRDISEWGKAIGKDGKGRSNLFELDLGKGNKRFTHVFWAD